jgi:uncharacterized protein YlxW (UPF0749 family)
MESETKDKPENKTTTAATTQQTPAANQEADLIASLLSFVKHPAVTAIGGFLVGKYFESQKQEREQEKITEKLQNQIESLKEQVKQLTNERKALGMNERELPRLNEGKYKNRGIIQLD